MRLVNLTPHELTIRAADGSIVRVEAGWAVGGPLPEFDTRDLGGGVTQFIPFPRLARCEQTSESAGTVEVPSHLEGRYDDPDGADPGRWVWQTINVTRQTFGPVAGLPSPIEGTRYIVSRIVAEACPERADLLFPGPAIRDGQGRVVGCDGLSVAAK